MIVPNQLIVRDISASSATFPAHAYTIPITATSGGLVRTAQARLQIGGAYIYLPLLVRE